MPRQEQPAPVFRQLQLQFIRGNVVLDDGSLAPANVVIESVCNGISGPVAYTNSNGSFTLQVGVASGGSMSDASNRDPGRRAGFGSVCELRASLPGFRSDVVRVDGGGVSDSNAGTIVLRRIDEVEGYTISVTTALAPKKAQKAYQNGINLARDGKWDKAEAQLRRAVEEYPRYAIAWQALGEALEAQQRPAEAREAYNKALEADSSFISPLLLIAVLAARENNWREMDAATSKVIRLNPIDFPQAYYFQAVARANLNDLEGAERSAREAIERGVEERYPDVERLLGMILAEQGKPAEASEHLGNYLELDPDGEHVESVRNYLAELDSQVAAQSQP